MHDLQSRNIECADLEHRFLEAAEGCLVPLRIAQIEHEGALLSLKLPAQQIQMIVRFLIIQDRAPNWRRYPRREPPGAAKPGAALPPVILPALRCVKLRDSRLPGSA